MLFSKIFIRIIYIKPTLKWRKSDIYTYWLYILVNIKNEWLYMAADMKTVPEKNDDDDEIHK